MLIKFTPLPYVIAQLLANSRENEQGFRNQHTHWCLRQNVLTPKNRSGFSTWTHAQHLPSKTQQSNNLHLGLEKGPTGFNCMSNTECKASSPKKMNWEPPLQNQSPNNLHPRSSTALHKTAASLAVLHYQKALCP